MGPSRSRASWRYREPTRGRAARVAVRREVRTRARILLYLVTCTVRYHIIHPTQLTPYLRSVVTTHAASHQTAVAAPTAGIRAVPRLRAAGAPH